MSNTRPTFVFVPGACHTLAHAQPLLDALQAKGYPAQGVALPTVGKLASSAPPNADAHSVRQALEELVLKQEQDVVLISHSYGGVPASQAVAGLEKSARSKAGHKGGVVKIVFVSAILALEGETVADAFSVTNTKVQSDKGVWFVPISETTFAGELKDAEEFLYHDLSSEKALYWAQQLEPMSLHIFSTPASGVCWGLEVGKVFIFSKNDRAFLFAAQQNMVERAKASGGDADSWKTYQIECGHSPFLSHVEELAGILTNEAKPYLDA
ncbi:AB hydrolase-1 domain-containing protein [Mycena indigotica]|uniref:AB hydrolase-1 domain-containing protein n=1 Tax=Mycena indigotica TaxID=2126181 RepID=A0A8H6TEZ8_9AGAR|nr:AB hydrolase-1 domain-containing protein [Mycena indigotica]KAF7315477.1 AB hydrolase-1 domain-containing protein [Mycena indigotica]